MAAKTRGAAYPTIATIAKIEALSGIGENREALSLTTGEMQRVSLFHLAGHLYDLHRTRASVYERMGPKIPLRSSLLRCAGAVCCV